MPKFEFYQEVKMKIWEKQFFTLEADTYEDALKFLEEHKNEEIAWMNDERISDTFFEYESECSEAIPPSENNGCATKMIYKTDDRQEPLFTNEL